MGCEPRLDPFWAQYGYGEDVERLVDGENKRELKGEKRMNELKPCPFCGGTNLYVDGYDHTAGKRWRVVCLDCMATVDLGWVQQKYRAIEAWNRRAEPANDLIKDGAQ